MKVKIRGIFISVWIGIGVLVLLEACNSNVKRQTDSKHEPLVQQAEYLVDTASSKFPEKLIDAKINNSKSQDPLKISQISSEVFDSDLPDFSIYRNTVNKKKAFFDFLRPLVINENKKVLQQRNYIISQSKLAEEGHDLMVEDLQKLADLASLYRVEYDSLGSQEFFRELLLHVDIIPTDLALVQAANESAWGSSYFARKGNNLYGQWCFTPGCGVVPRKRKDGDTHEVATYNDLSHSIRSYIQYLNSHPAFKRLRMERFKARELGEKPSGYEMARGLKLYSGIGMDYVSTLQSMIKKNQKYITVK